MTEALAAAPISSLRTRSLDDVDPTIAKLIDAETTKVPPFSLRWHAEVIRRILAVGGYAATLERRQMWPYGTSSG